MLGRCFRASNKASLASSKRPCELRTLPKFPRAERIEKEKEINKISIKVLSEIKHQKSIEN